MDPDLWERVESTLFDALRRTPEARAAFVAEACAGDDELRREVEAQLRAYEDDPAFLEQPVARVHALDVHEAEAPPDTRIGPYRPIRVLARGGMGEVYLAVWEGPGFRKTVAIKVMRRGLHTEDAVRRFRLERRILASLEHPGIARLLDGGTTPDGRPYLVMEYVDGEPVDAYCDRHGLSVRRRIELFLDICAVVHDAHRNLVIHRDLKPSNILVTRDGAPKLLDFGIGKLLSPDTEWDASARTRTELRVLTLEYAAPEQVRGDAITTATDVYALGVVLYELLTGRRPHAAHEGSRADLGRAIRELEPPAPSTTVARRNGVAPTADPAARQTTTRDPPWSRLRHRLTRDLDMILLKALRKEPEQRYPSAQAFAADLERFLRGHPVRARPDTLRYRTWKFVRRHTLGLGAVAAVILALAATSAVTFVQSQRAARERDRALEVRSFLMELFGATGADRATGDTITVRRVLDLQAESVDALYADRPELRARMLEVLAEGYDRLGLYDDAEPLARRALELRRSTGGAGSPDIAGALNLVGWILHQRGEAEQAETLLREAVEIRRSAGGRHRLELARSLNDLGVVVEARGALAEAEELYREALAIRLDRLGPEHRSVGITANNLATTLYRQGAYEEAARAGSRALEALRATLGPDHQRSVIAQGNLAVMAIAAGRLEYAEAQLRDLVERQRRLQGPTHPVTAAQMLSLAGVLNRRSRFAEAETYARQALEIRESALDPRHPDMAWSLSVLADALEGQARYREALELRRRALAVFRSTPGPDHARVAGALSQLADVYAALGMPDSALLQLERALEIGRSPELARRVDALRSTVARSGPGNGP